MAALESPRLSDSAQAAKQSEHDSAQARFTLHQCLEVRYTMRSTSGSSSISALTHLTRCAQTAGVQTGSYSGHCRGAVPHVLSFFWFA